MDSVETDNKFIRTLLLAICWQILQQSFNQNFSLWKRSICRTVFVLLCPRDNLRKKKRPRHPSAANFHNNRYSLIL